MEKSAVIAPLLRGIGQGAAHVMKKGPGQLFSRVAGIFSKNPAWKQRAADWKNLVPDFKSMTGAQAAGHRIGGVGAWGLTGFGANYLPYSLGEPLGMAYESKFGDPDTFNKQTATAAKTRGEEWKNMSEGERFGYAFDPLSYSDRIMKDNPYAQDFMKRMEAPYGGGVGNALGSVAQLATTPAQFAGMAAPLADWQVQNPIFKPLQWAANAAGYAAKPFEALGNVGQYGPPGTHVGAIESRYVNDAAARVRGLLETL